MSMIRTESLQIWVKKYIFRESEPFSSISICKYCGHMVTAKGSSTQMAELYAKLKLLTHIKLYCNNAPQDKKDSITIVIKPVNYKGY